jgi:uncharacterized protein (DUF1330 family)
LKACVEGAADESLRDRAVEGWYKSADYQKIIGLRHKSSHGDLVILDGA